MEKKEELKREERDKESGFFLSTNPKKKVSPNPSHGSTKLGVIKAFVSSPCFLHTSASFSLSLSLQHLT